ncbi:MAG: T9SS type A sorting domain-containing protein [Bacteroidota bacterium]
MNKYFCTFTFPLLFLFLFSKELAAQSEAFSNAFNTFERITLNDAGDGAGFSMYTAVWAIHQQYPGPSFQVGLPHTWLKPLETGREPDPFNNTIEGGLGWWRDTRFATETPKFIMGGVPHNFVSWANGVGAGQSAIRSDGHRDWSQENGMHGVAQLSPHLLWPPDGLNMEQGTNGKFLGYAYHPLPLIDALQQTRGVNYPTGNQSYTLFLNSSNFKGPACFFIPSYWTEWVVNEPSLLGLYHDSRPTDKNQTFAIEYPGSPALIGNDNNGQTYARITPLVFPKTSPNKSENLRDVKVHTKAAKWDAVENWFNGGSVPATEFQTTNSLNILFEVEPFVDGNIATDLGENDPGFFEYPIKYDFATKINSSDKTVAGFQWDTNVVNEVNGSYITPEYYQLNQNNQWEPIPMSSVPASTGLLSNAPDLSPRNDDVPYLTPMEPDCHLQDPASPWRSPGPSAGPFTVELGDGSRLTYYWYRFIDQPAIIHANLPANIRQSLQSRVEMIHMNWQHTDEYLPAPSGGVALTALDSALIVHPPAGMEIGYVPIVTRQEKSTSTTSISRPEDLLQLVIYPNPTKGQFRIESKNQLIAEVKLFTLQGQLLATWQGQNQHRMDIQMNQQPRGIYFLSISTPEGITSGHRIIKID